MPWNLLRPKCDAILFWPKSIRIASRRFVYAAQNAKMALFMSNGTAPGSGHLFRSREKETGIPFLETRPFSSRQGKKGFFVLLSREGKREFLPFAFRCRPLYIFSFFLCRGHAYAPLHIGKMMPPALPSPRAVFFARGFTELTPPCASVSVGCVPACGITELTPTALPSPWAVFSVRGITELTPTALPSPWAVFLRVV